MKPLLVEQKQFQSLQTLFPEIEHTPIIAGPCAIESVQQMERVAEFICSYGLHFIRGGAFKPRTSPYTFQGLERDGLQILNDVRQKYSLISVTEVMDTREVQIVSEHSDILQIGSRNMSNYPLLKEVGKVSNPILLKRGYMASLREFLLAAEYIVLAGNARIILCERGIRTFEQQTRNTLDLSCVAMVKKTTSLPIIVDLSHSLGRKDIIVPMAKASLASGADGLMMELHPDPNNALSDNGQQLDFIEFDHLYKSIF